MAKRTKAEFSLGDKESYWSIERGGGKITTDLKYNHSNITSYTISIVLMYLSHKTSTSYNIYFINKPCICVTTSQEYQLDKAHILRTIAQTWQTGKIKFLCQKKFK